VLPVGHDGRPLVYDLYAVSDHFGGLGGGHCEFRQRESEREREREREREGETDRDRELR
jgi:hypothetical protein